MEQEVNKSLFSDILKNLLQNIDKNNLNESIIKSYFEYFPEKEEKDFVNLSTEIDQSIKRLRENYQEIQKYKALGNTRINWLKENIKKSTDKHNLNLKDILKIIEEEIISANNSFTGENLIEKVETITPEILNDEIEEYNLKNIQKNIQDNQYFYTIDLLKEDSKSEQFESENLHDFFDCELEDEKEMGIKKLLAFALNIFKEISNLKFIKGMDNTQIFSIADFGVSFVKSIVHLAQQKIDRIDFINYLIDKGVANLAYFVEVYAEKYGPQIFNYLGKAIGNVFGPHGVYIGQIVGQVASSFAGEAVRKFLPQGVKIASEFLKTTFKSATHIVNKAVKFIFG